MSNYDDGHVVKSDKELQALCQRAKNVSSKAIARWTRDDEAVMLIANSNAKRFGYKDWYDAHTRLSKRYW